MHAAKDTDITLVTPGMAICRKSRVIMPLASVWHDDKEQ